METKFYCSLLSTVVALHDLEFINIQARVSETIQTYTYVKNLSAKLQEHSRLLKTIVSDQLMKVQSYLECIEKILSSKEEQGLMSLTLLKGNPSLYQKPLNVYHLNSQEEIEV